MNPGSHAPQACILDHQPKKFPRIQGFLSKLDDDPAFQDYSTRVLKTIEDLMANGKAANTLRSVMYALRRLNREVDLMNPDAVKLHIAQLEVSNQTKQKLINNYAYFVKTNNLQWERPKYRWDVKIPLIPLKQNVEAIISGSTLKTATIFTILAETGLEGAELHNVKRKDIDIEQGIITAEGNKGHRGRNFKLKQRTAEMLRTYLQKYTSAPQFVLSALMYVVGFVSYKAGQEKEELLQEKLKTPIIRKKANKLVSSGMNVPPSFIASACAFIVALLLQNSLARAKML